MNYEVQAIAVDRLLYKRCQITRSDKHRIASHFGASIVRDGPRNCNIIRNYRCHWNSGCVWDLCCKDAYRLRQLGETDTVSGLDSKLVYSSTLELDIGLVDRVGQTCFERHKATG